MVLLIEFVVAMGFCVGGFLLIGPVCYFVLAAMFIGISMAIFFGTPRVVPVEDLATNRRFSLSFGIACLMAIFWPGVIFGLLFEGWRRERADCTNDDDGDARKSETP
jgi:hypothetical protein